ncbi:MAG: thioredoxin domain-containing protein [Thermosynechococcaceae cyanobacterium]
MANRLATAHSLYLRKHAENPIDWQPWDPDALDQAQRENKPIFLSVGYSSCHWCTVMEGEAFSDPAIAAYLNAHFLPIKVDREERPDLDSIYMSALQAMTGQGGWPMNLFLTPDDLVPFYGGTYFPVEPRYGRPGFLDVLQALYRFYETEKTQLMQQTQKLMGFLHHTTNLAATSALTLDLLHQGLQISTEILSRKTPGPSFPMMPYALWVQQGHRFQTILNPALQRGLDLALGGIYDHVAGGFHRYTVDPTWTVPHFEKMLYDNGQIVEFLANLWSAGYRDLSFQRAIAGTVQWLTREMTDPAGYFYAAQDADTFVQPSDPEPEEGRFYVWTYDELQALLTSDEWDALQTAFQIQPQGNFEQGQIVLQRQHSGELSDLVEGAIAKLFQVRYGTTAAECSTFPPARNNRDAKENPWLGRIPPVTDTKMIVSWNGLMISGLARAAAVLRDPVYLALASQAAQFILDHQWQDGRLHRIYYDQTAAVPAQSEDYAFFIKALLDLQQAALALNQPAAAQVWLQSALTVQQEFDEHLWALDGGGYYSAARDAAAELMIRERSWMDNATPSANGIAIANLVRLAFLSDRLDFLDQAEQALNTFSAVLDASPSGCPSLFSALDWFGHATVVRLRPHQMSPVMAQNFWPTAVLAIADDLPEAAFGLVCEGTLCLPPVATESDFVAQVTASLTRSRTLGSNPGSPGNPPLPRPQ